MSLLHKFLSGSAAALALILAPPPHSGVGTVDVGPAPVAVALPPEAPALASEDIDTFRTASIAAETPPPGRPIPQVLPPAPPLAPLELLRFQATAQLYRKGLYPAADAIAQTIDDPVQRVALEWLALKSSGAPDGVRLARFAAAHSDWPDAGWIGAVRGILALQPPCGGRRDRCGIRREASADIAGSSGAGARRDFRWPGGRRAQGGGCAVAGT